MASSKRAIGTSFSIMGNQTATLAHRYIGEEATILAGSS
jgi:hypothetical protein